MKKIFWILLVLNSVVFAYFRLDAMSPAESTLKPALHPEKMKLVKDADLASYPMRVASVPVAPEATPSDNTQIEEKPATEQLEKGLSTAPLNSCYEWGSFASNRVNEAVDAANNLGVQHSVQALQPGNDNKRYWIYKPPLATPEAAQAKADELRRLGIQDFFIVQDPKWRNAISFGVFREEKLADKLMEDLKNKGVRLLIKSTRFGGQGQAVLKLQSVSPEQYASLQKLQPHFPDSVIRSVPCE